VKIPATAEGIPAIAATIGRGLSINVTLIFSLSRYEQVIEAYLHGLETLAAGGGDLAAVRSVASFFVSRVDTQVDHRLEQIGGKEALALRGHAGIAQARLAYQMFRDRFAGPRWEKLAALGAHPQPPLWASTTTKNPDYPDTRYVDSLIGPGTINTMAESTIAAFEDHGTVARTIDTDIGAATRVMQNLRAVGIDIDDVGRTLEDQGVAGFHESFADLMITLRDKAHQLAQQ
jgi:transaldolase